MKSTDKTWTDAVEVTSPKLGRLMLLGLGWEVTKQAAHVLSLTLPKQPKMGPHIEMMTVAVTLYESMASRGTGYRSTKYVAVPATTLLADLTGEVTLDSGRVTWMDDPRIWDRWVLKGLYDLNTGKFEGVVARRVEE